jgi:hypothetical protein
MGSLRQLDVNVLWGEIPERYRKLPLDVFEEPAHDFDLARRRLELYLVQTTKHGPAEQVRQRIKQHRPGLLALKWLISNRGEKIKEFMVDASFCSAMVFSLVADGQVPVLEEMMRLPKDAELIYHSGVQSQDIVQRRWRELILRHLVEAQAYWSPSIAPFDESLATFLAWWRRMPIGQGYARLAVDWLHSRCSEKHLPIDPQLFNGLIVAFSAQKGLHQLTGSDFKGFWGLARVHLRHPVQPDPGHMLRFFSLSQSRDPVYQESEFARELCEGDV